MSLTFDGAASNFALSRCLGAGLNFYSSTVKTTFNHLSDPPKIVPSNAGCLPHGEISQELFGISHSSNRW